MLDRVRSRVLYSGPFGLHSTEWLLLAYDNVPDLGAVFAGEGVMNRDIYRDIVMKGRATDKPVREIKL